ncbi:MAG: type II secretion system protein GspG [Acidobacteriota bacterium]
MQYCAYCGNPVEAVSYAPCAKCGNPTNGAPRPRAGTGGGSNAVAIIIGVAAGGLVLIAIIGILAAIAIPNLLTAMQRSKQKRTMADIRSIASAVEAYASDNNEYPKSLDQIAPRYLKVVPRADGWGHPLEYECVTDETGKCTRYVIGSRAKDGRFEGGDLRDAVPQTARPTANFDCDILYSNGAFMEYPEGFQR